MKRSRYIKSSNRNIQFIVGYSTDSQIFIANGMKVFHDIQRFFVKIRYGLASVSDHVWHEKRTKRRCARRPPQKKLHRGNDV